MKIGGVPTFLEIIQRVYQGVITFHAYKLVV